jgi:hypothetical protein
MFKKYSTFMMLLIATASLIGISTIYQPANVETQPQLQKPIPGTQGLITQQRAETLAQATADKQLLDRLFPQIIKRIDGNTLLQKIDAKTLAAKVLPYLDLKVSVTERPGQTSSVNTGGTSGRGIAQARAGCAPGETIVSSGFQNRVPGIPELNPMISRILNNPPNNWLTATGFTEDGQLLSFANCLNVELALKDVQQPQPTPPPGGPPLQPPSQQPSGGPIVR